eukprot:5247233-Pleurochrysis_carterae.AAC.3
MSNLGNGRLEEVIIMKGVKLATLVDVSKGDESWSFVLLWNTAKACQRWPRGLDRNAFAILFWLWVGARTTLTSARSCERPVGAVQDKKVSMTKLTNRFVPCLLPLRVWMQGLPLSAQTVAAVVKGESQPESMIPADGTVVFAIHNGGTHLNTAFFRLY